MEIVISKMDNGYAVIMNPESEDGYTYLYRPNLDMVYRTLGCFFNRLAVFEEEEDDS